MPDTCDSKECPATAAVIFLTTGGPLTFCSHHGSQHAPAMSALGYMAYPLTGETLYAPAGWKACGFGLPVNGPDRHHGV